MSLRHSKQWLVLLQTERRAVGLDVFLVPERCRIVRSSLRLLGVDAGHAGSIAGGSVSLRFEPVSAATGVVGVLELEYTGDAPVVAGIEWLVEGSVDARAFSYALEVEALVDLGLVLAGDKEVEVTPVPWEAALRMIGEPVDVVVKSGSQPPSIAAIDPGQEVFALRRTALLRDEAARRFFFELDDATLGPAVDPGRQELFEGANEALAQRVIDRAGVGDRYVPAWEESDLFSKRMCAVSSFVRTLMEVHLDERAWPGVTEWAFTRFATECLCAGHTDPDVHERFKAHGAPNGELFFSFAELGLTCVSLEIDPAFWSQHLGTMVLAAHLYAEHGWARNAHGRVVYAFRRERRFPLKRLRALHASYRPPLGEAPEIFFEDRFTNLMSKALPVPKQQNPPEKKRDLLHKVELRRQRTHLVNESQARSFFSAFPFFKAPLDLR